jgi:hypothetical protein
MSVLPADSRLRAYICGQIQSILTAYSVDYKANYSEKIMDDLSGHFFPIYCYREEAFDPASFLVNIAAITAKSFDSLTKLVDVAEGATDALMWLPADLQDELGANREVKRYVEKLHAKVHQEDDGMIMKTRCQYITRMINFFKKRYETEMKATGVVADPCRYEELMYKISTAVAGFDEYRQKFIRWFETIMDLIDRLVRAAGIPHVLTDDNDGDDEENGDEDAITVDSKVSARSSSKWASGWHYENPVSIVIED